MEQLTFKIKGVAPLLMHNGQLADPLNKYSMLIKEISAKRAKTEADYEAMARLEFLGGLYLDKNGVPCIPGSVLEGMLLGKGGASRKQRQGKAAAAGVFCSVASFPVEYDGPKDLEQLWKDERFRLRVPVVVGQAKVMRTRPMFEEWAAEVSVCVLPDLVNPKDIALWMDIAGREVGLMDWRPKFGRFEVVG